ncbi:MAG TPA: glycosyltransferase family 2 protein [Puia sp.]|nr:glycosyltransferase family 2 protein [Puia sp.]
MKVSIITATYNSAATVNNTLSCIQFQDHPDIEHIIVDGLSSDDTLKIVNRFPHIAKIISEKDEGIYDAMNKGIRCASGEIIGILNSDDVYTDEHVLSTIASVFENKEIDACYADLQYVRQNDSSKIVRTWKSGYFSGDSFYWGWMPPHPTFFVRRSVYEKVGLFNTMLKSAADYEMMLRILVKYKITVHYIPKVIVKMSTGGMSNVSVRNRIKANQEDRLAWKLNGLRPYFFTLYLKPLRKVSQFLIK